MDSYEGEEKLSALISGRRLLSVSESFLSCEFSAFVLRKLHIFIHLFIASFS